ncbi:MAG: sigma-70 family RNA polymerase sigma factor [Clostridia bacterium]|nr:sigma-70 family RNA polymerase sigma factor [Clostridia bacterium]
MWYKEDHFSWDELSPAEQASLVRAAAEGEEGAFPLLAKTFDPSLRYLIRSLGAPRSEAEDLRQEGLLGLYKACLLFDPEKASFATFARLCMRSNVVDALRRAAPVDEVPLAEAEKASPAADPQKILVDKERLRRLLTEMDRILSPLERRIIIQRLRGDDSGEIARALGLTRRAVDNALFRGRAKLKQVDMPE